MGEKGREEKEETMAFLSLEDNVPSVLEAYTAFQIATSSE